MTDPREARTTVVRAPRRARHPLVRLLPFAAVLVAVGLLGQVGHAAVGDSVLGSLLVGTATAGAALAAYRTLVGLLERRPVRELGAAAARPAEAGLLLGAAYVATRALWLPIGLHLGWNLAEAGIFTTAVSGSGSARQGLLEGATSGPTLLTGGSFGPEASLVSVVVCTGAAAALLRLAKRRGHLVPRPARPR